MVLMDSSGLITTEEATFANKERAFLDTLYAFPFFHFDNLRSIDWEQVLLLLPIYRNKRLEKHVSSIRQKELQV